MPKTAIFAIFSLRNSHNSAIFQNIKNSEIQIVSIYVRRLWCKFQQNRTKIATPDTFCVKYFKFQFFGIFYKRSYQNRELQNAITSERGWILTFRKKLLFLLIEIFQMSSTWFFWPWPPYRLKLYGRLRDNVTWSEYAKPLGFYARYLSHGTLNVKYWCWNMIRWKITRNYGILFM